MANIEHSTLTTTNLHENKGVSTATTNTVATAVAGATVWAKLTDVNLTGTGNSFGTQLFHVQHQTSSGTSGGSTSTGSFLVRPLTTTLTNEIAGSSLASNQITLPAGTYYLEAQAVTEQSGQTKHKIRNVTDGSDTLISLNENLATSAGTVNWSSYLSGRFTISGTKVFELQYRVGTAIAGAGLGRAAGFGVTEIYADVKIWKLA